MRKVYWWTEGCQGWSTPNFGDELVPLLLESAYVKQFEWSPPAEAEFVIAGSVLEHLPSNWAGTVCGAGLLHESSHLNLREAEVLGVRGKLTLDRLAVKSREHRNNVVLGDPALLVPSWIRQYQGKWDVGIIPHWSDNELMRRFPYGHYIDVRRPPHEVIEDIAKCKRVISSSLHGIIVADAYGIPRQAELFPDALSRAQHEGGDFKYRDYATNFDGDPHFGEFWKAPHEQVAQIQENLRQMLARAMQTTPPPAAVPHPRHRHNVCRRLPCKRPQLSLLVPFRDDHEFRARVWRWLKQYWYDHLESVEIIEGHDCYWPFSKAAAVNDAASRARGRVFAILDADTIMDTRILQHYVDNIDRAVRHHKRLWYIPYDKLYRLNQEATLAVLGCDSSDDYFIPSPPPPDWLDDSPLRGHDANSIHYGHKYGALIQLLPREAFFMVGGMDPRFRGWGSEDASFMRAVDTVYCQHDLGDNDVVHLWHARSGMSWDTRRWVGQSDVVTNTRLAQRYAMATSEQGFMRALTSEYAAPKDVLRRRLFFCPSANT